MERFAEYNFFKSNKDLKSKAKEALNGNKKHSLWINFIFWLVKLSFFAGLAFLIIALINLNSGNFITFIIVSAVLLVISLLLYGPTRISVCKNALNMVNNTNPSFKDFSFGFKHYLKNVGFGFGLFIRYIFNLILLIVPFGFKYINSQFAPYILAENPEMSVNEAFKQSALYMKGFKKSYFKLVCSFWLSFVLSIVTVYIYSLFFRPMFNASVCCLYFDLKE